MCRENLLETTSPHFPDDTAKSMTMRCLGIVGLEDGPKRVSGFAVDRIAVQGEHASAPFCAFGRCGR